ncbi:WG repeat-containing protein [Saccharibacillus alkalitolerans]|uniref:WG repeat-containing protein n=1 Tax=Saccharibacillus alkalitolerans TaxID=2705290 RepID=A0ABX0F2P2_9BACL|nr:WG repeat-containing protein [Saccharibacillus alkalitolerans]NGZ75181.1 WG repeat-containing protein [Saccharibacillus alkalitolerans]
MMKRMLTISCVVGFLLIGANSSGPAHAGSTGLHTDLIHTGTLAETSSVSDDLYPVIIGENQIGFIDAGGNAIEGLVYNQNELGTDLFIEGLIGVKQGKLWGFADRTGKLVIPPKYQDIRSFSSGRAAAKANNKWGFINRAGKWVVQPTYREVQDFHEGRAAVKINKSWGYIDLNGSLIVKAKFKAAGQFSEGLAGVQVNDTLLVYIDKNGREVIRYPAAPFGTLEAGPFRNGAAAIVINGNSVFYIDKTGKLIFDKGQDPEYRHFLSDWPDFSEGLAGVKNSKYAYQKYGFIDTTGKFAIKPAYDFVKPFHNGLAAVSLNDKWGYVNKQGKVVIPIQYDNADDFKGELAMVSRNGQIMYIGKQGQRVWTFAYPTP